MGGRGSGSGRGGSGVQPKKTTLDEYLGARGLSSPISDYMDDKIRNPHGMTERQKKKFQKDAAAAADEYQKKRSAAIKEYQAGVKSGKIVEKSRIDVLLDRARGHEDNESTQAARRALKKRGINWKTGKKL
nr:MAG TPA: hypothetical protein [Caudoviricetes sp.]